MADQDKIEGAMSEQPKRQLRSLPANTKSFQAGGHTYYVEDDLSVERYQVFQKMEIELGYGLKFSELFQKIKEAFEKNDQGHHGQVAVILYQLMEGIAYISEKRPIALWVATLFINRSDEDRSVWNKTLAEEKLKDWGHGHSDTEQGIEVTFFLIVSLGAVRSFAESWSQTLELLEKVGPLNPEKMTEGFDLLPVE